MITRLLRSRKRGAILMYHRIARVAHDPWGLAVSPEHFAAQLAALKRSHCVLPLAELAELAAKGRAPRGGVAISFDDGYVDNLVEAAPILAAEGMPATLFLATGPTLGGRGYWFEELAELVLDAPDPADLSLEVGPARHPVVWGPREAVDDDRGDWRGWEAPRTARERAFCGLWEAIRVIDPADQARVIARLAADLGRPMATPARPMTREEAQRLASSTPFTLGGHTRDHADLLALGDQEALDQIVRGKQDVETLTGTRCAGFAYPYGRHDARIAALVEQAGFDWACTTEHAHLRGRPAKRFYLPRIQAEDRPDIGWLN